MKKKLCVENKTSNPILVHVQLYGEIDFHEQMMDVETITVEVEENTHDSIALVPGDVLEMFIEDKVPVHIKNGRTKMNGVEE